VRCLNADTTFAGNGLDGFHAEDTTFTGMLFLNSTFNANGLSTNNGDGGIEIIGGEIKQGTVTFDDGTPNTLQTGFTLQDSQVVGNSDDGVEFDTVTATDVTFKGDTIAENGDDGVFITDSDVSDLVIQNSYLGATSTLKGNGGNGFDAFNATITGAAFLDSFFNENGFDGIDFDTTTITSGTVTFDNGTPQTLTTGFTLQNSQALGNDFQGVLLFDSDVADVTFKNAILADNRQDGLFIVGTEVAVLTIDSSFLGAAPNGSGGKFLGNDITGFEIQDSSFTGSGLRTPWLPEMETAECSSTETTRSVIS
jgi:hypothetical protein